MDNIRAMEYSITRSSVTDRFTRDQLEHKLALLERARQELDRGNLRTADELVVRAGRLLYRMADSDNAMAHPDLPAWLDQTDALIGAIAVEAQRIAAEKGRPALDLSRVDTHRQLARDAQSQGRLDDARRSMTAAYLGVQQQVAALRSGDVLRVALPEPGSQQAWLDAQRRYDEWVYMGATLRDDAVPGSELRRTLDDALTAAGGLKREADALAAQQRWGDAVQRLDRAFREIESSWRLAGLDL